MFFNFSYGANWNPNDGGMLPIIAILDKLVESPDTQLHVESCLKILLKTVPAIEMPYKVHVRIGNGFHDRDYVNEFHHFYLITAIYVCASKRDIHQEI